MPNEILRIQVRLKDLRSGNISQQNMLGPIISTKSILSSNEHTPRLGGNKKMGLQSIKLPRSDVINFIN
jgi:hypothetical protein